MFSRMYAQATPSASAQLPKTAPTTMQLLSSYEGQKVVSIEIAGRPDLKSSQFASLFIQQAGQPFSKEKVDQTAAALKATGKFEQVQLQIDPDANGVRVLLILEPAVYFGVFQFPGAQQFSYSRLVQVANYPIQTPIDASQVEQDRQSLITFFRQQGYFQAKVQSEVEVDSKHALANVVFPVTLGRRASSATLKSRAPPREMHSTCNIVCKPSWPARTALAFVPEKPTTTPPSQERPNTSEPSYKNRDCLAPKSNWTERNITPT